MTELKQTAPHISRRQFLTRCAPAVGSLALFGAGVSTVGASSAGAGSGGDPEHVPAILIDVTRCEGCNNCQRCCAEANGLSCDEPAVQLDADTYTVVEEHLVDGGETRYVKRACMHCLHPGCVAACPVAALHRSPEGLVVADTQKCIGCRYCQYACPFEVPKFEWDNALGVMRKCTACLERLSKGELPACAAGCPTGALKAGQRGDLLKEARARIAAHKAHYLDHIYGEHEVGGTNRLYISDAPFEELGLPAVSNGAVPRYSDPVVTKTPVIALGVAAISTATYTLLRRRERGLEYGNVEIEEK